MEYTGLEEMLVVAEAVLGIPAEELQRTASIPLAESALHAPQAGFGDEEFYPDSAVKAAILCSRIVRNHALPDGNKRTALLLMLDFIERNGMRWIPPAGGQKEIADTIEALAGGALSEDAFVKWVRAHVEVGVRSAVRPN